MTIKQMLIASAIGAAALGTMLHRLPKHPLPMIKPSASLVKMSRRGGQARRLHAKTERLSMNKLFGQSSR